MTSYRLRASGTFDVFENEHAILENARAYVAYHLPNDATRLVFTTALRDAATLVGQDEHVVVELRIASDALSLRVTHRGALPLALDELNVLDCDVARAGTIQLANARALRYLHHGWQSWSPVAVRRTDSRKIPTPPRCPSRHWEKGNGHTENPTRWRWPPG